MTNQDMVEEFHRAFDRPINVSLDWDHLHTLRCNLLIEECNEVLDSRNIYELAKELADVLYITYGTAVTYGIPLDAVFAEVHRSNMSKLGEDGKPVVREDGKILKGPNYRIADVEKVLLNASK